MIPIYDEKYFDPPGDFRRGDDTMGIAPFVIPLVTAMPSMIQSVLGIFGFGKPKAQFQGLAGIQSGGQQLLQALSGIKTALGSGQISPQEAVSEAQRLGATINDTTIFYPAKKGLDAAELTKIKGQVAAAVTAIEQLAAQVTQAMQAAGVDPRTGQPLPSSSPLGGLSTTTLLMAAGGLLGVYFLTQNQNQNQYQYQGRG